VGIEQAATVAGLTDGRVEGGAYSPPAPRRGWDAAAAQQFTGVRRESHDPVPANACLSSTLVAAQVRELTERFGGLTVHTRAPAEGLWKDESERTARDDVVKQSRTFKVGLAVAMSRSCPTVGRRRRG
jgi:hypothetical protein